MPPSFLIRREKGSCRDVVGELIVPLRDQARHGSRAAARPSRAGCSWLQAARTSERRENIIVTLPSWYT